MLVFSKKNGLVIILGLMLIISSIAQANQQAEQQNNSQQTRQFLALSDIHFDPFVDCPSNNNHCQLITELQKYPYYQWQKVFSQYGSQLPSQYGHDTNYALWQSLLK